MFIAIEGLDFTGKSTLVKQLFNLSVERNEESRQFKHIRTTRSPGGVEEAELLRNLMLEGRSLSPESRNLLASASRQVTSDMLLETENALIISDRWTHSGYAYQVVGEGTSAELFMMANEKVIKPDLYVILRLDPDTYQARKDSLESNTRDVMEEMLVDKEFQLRVDRAILETRLPGSKYVVIDVQNQTPEELALLVYDKYIDSDI